ncbi:unnamed protein product [Urochloa humidicola]
MSPTCSSFFFCDCTTVLGCQISFGLGELQPAASRWCGPRGRHKPAADGPDSRPPPRKILASDGKGYLYRGFGLSILTNAPSDTMAQRFLWHTVGAERSDRHWWPCRAQAPRSPVAHRRW